MRLAVLRSGWTSPVRAVYEAGPTGFGLAVGPAQAIVFKRPRATITPADFTNTHPYQRAFLFHCYRKADVGKRWTSGGVHWSNAVYLGSIVIRCRARIEV